MFLSLLALSLSLDGGMRWYTCAPIKGVLQDIRSDNNELPSTSRMQFRTSISPTGDIQINGLNSDDLQGRLHLTKPANLAVGREQVILNWSDGPISIAESGHWAFGEFGDAYFSGVPKCLGTLANCQRDLILRELSNGYLAMTLSVVTNRIASGGKVSPPRVLIATARCKPKAQKQ